MNKRVTAAIGAAVLAVLGVVVLVMWAQGANDRAFEGAELVSVVRATDDIADGTPVAELGSKTEVAKLPAEAIPEGAVTNLDSVAGLNTNASLQAGEVLLKSRFVAPGDRKGGPNVPEGFQEVSFAVDGERSLGGAIAVGDRIGILGSFDPVDAGDEVSFTNYVKTNVLVTRVSSTITGEELTAQLVTVAVKTRDAEKIVFAKEFGTVWLTLQNADTDQSGGDVITLKDLL